jgi:hypothetical protein
MYTARCTPRVLEALHLPVAENDQDSTTALGDWYVDFIQTRKHRLVHFVSDRSLLSVVVPVKTLTTALDRHVAGVASLLAALNLEPAVVEAEIAQMHQRGLGNARSQSVLASMLDLANRARSTLESAPSIAPEELSFQLGQVPLDPLAMRTPAQAATTLLRERYSRMPGDVHGA